MMAAEAFEQIIDPVEMLNGILERAWTAVCKAYDTSGDLPDMRTLFDEADLSIPDQAAQLVLVNMITEIIQCVGRFSPWYTQPARAFGLTSLRNPITNQTQWVLAPEAIQKWCPLLQELAVAIQKNSGLIQAIVLVDGLMEPSPDEPCATLRCGCVPPHAIRLRKSILQKTDIYCDTCNQPFT